MIKEKKQRYTAPELYLVRVESERLMGLSNGESISLGGKDTDAGTDKDASGHVWADVKANTVDWDE